MLRVVFTLDYELYGNGSGRLRELVYEPGERLREVFHRWNARFVNFVEVAEFQKIEQRGTDDAISLVTRQIRELYEEGFEVGIHLHPQWFNATYSNGGWVLDYSEYNLCTLPQPRIAAIVDQALEYLRGVLAQPQFTPLSFRAGNWLFQPTAAAAGVLAAKGFKLDSSVFKGGLQHKHALDYRPALRNGYYWPFSHNVNRADPAGPWIEIPVYAEMVPFWRMLTGKRVGLQTRGGTSTQQTAGHRLQRLRDYLRPRYPLKLDFCRMTLAEMTRMMDRLALEDRQEPGALRPIVAIGHTKDLIDIDAVSDFLGYLRDHEIPVSTFEDIYPSLLGAQVTPRESALSA